MVGPGILIRSLMLDPSVPPILLAQAWRRTFLASRTDRRGLLHFGQGRCPIEADGQDVRVGVFDDGGGWTGQPDQGYVICEGPLGLGETGVMGHIPLGYPENLAPSVQLLLAGPAQVELAQNHFCHLKLDILGRVAVGGCDHIPSVDQGSTAGVNDGISGV